MRIVHLERKYIGQIVEIHSRAFPNFFLSFLGPDFLREFYQSFTEADSGISWVAVDDLDSHVIGVVVGTRFPSGFFRALLVRRWWAFGLASLRALFKKPSIIRRLLRAVAYRGDAPGKPGFALLSSIAVAPETQGMGFGKALLEAWVEEAKKRKCRGAYLTTDALDNDSVNCFYRKAGWKLESTFLTPEGRRMNRYVIVFDDPGS